LKKILTAVFAAALMTASSAEAQATRTWVSGNGDDANPCSRTAPCKTFAGAISKTATGGYINAMDPGGFGAVTITKSITIDGGGGSLAGAVGASPGQSTIIINSASAMVILRNLSLEGAGTGANGIRVIAAAQVHVEHCTIQNYASNGILFDAAGDLFVSDTNVKDVTDQGIYVRSGRATLERVGVNGTGFGVLVGVTGRATMRNSSASGNIVGVASAYASTAHTNLEGVVLANNSYGLYALHGSTVRLSNVTLSNNSVMGMFNDGTGLIVSYGNNRFANNPSDGAFTSTVAQK
jgi:hypothetical protein